MLPTIDLPQYELKLPSTGEPILVRPFLVKEEKLLFMALESKDDNEITRTTKQIIKNCILSDGINVDKLPFFDVDYLFIALRAKSVGESIEVKFTCKSIREDGNYCNNTFPATIDISNCKIVKNESLSKNITLSGNQSAVMKYPSYSAMRKLNTNGVFEDKILLIAECIDLIQDGEKIYTNKDFTKDELVQYIESMTQDQFKKLEAWVDDFPSFLVESDAVCTKCGFIHHLEYKDFSSFFV